MAVTYAVAKYVPDLFRQEPRNVGVFVANEEAAVVRLLGDAGSGKLDLRRAGPAREDGDIYAEWFAHWHRLVNRVNASPQRAPVATELLTALQADGGDMFAVWAGGDYLVDDEDEENLEEIASELFGRLVTGVEAEAEEDEETEQPKLHVEMKRIFQEAGILEDKRRRQQDVRHPIRMKEEVRGTLAVPYRPSFSQLNGKLTVIEDIDFAAIGEEKLQNHALSTAFMFRDIARARLQVEPVELITVVHLHPDRNQYPQEVGMAALKEVEGMRIVNWDIPRARDRFIEERIRVAHADY